MRLSTLLLSLLGSSFVAAADDQIPLKEKAAGWFDKAKSYIPSSIPNPIDAGAAAFADAKVEKINARNWQRKLQPKLEGEEEWMVLLTGGNKSCFGRCGPAETTWNESVPALLALNAARTAGTPPLHVGFLDCEKDVVICTGFAAVVPAIYHFIFPAKPADGSSAPPTQFRPILLNLTTTTIGEITSIPRVGKATYLEHPTYDGWLHPVDSLMAKTGLMYPMGFVVWGFGTTPSWLMMIGISFLSRQFMSRRMMNPNRPDLYGGAPAGQQAAAPPAAAAPASPAGGKGSGKKKR